jgi:hypothetical protein
MLHTAPIRPSAPTLVCDFVLSAKRGNFFIGPFRTSSFMHLSSNSLSPDHPEDNASSEVADFSLTGGNKRFCPPVPIRMTAIEACIHTVVNGLHYCIKRLGGG